MTDITCARLVAGPEFSERIDYIEAANLRPELALTARIVAALEDDPPDGLKIEVCDWPRFLVAIGWTPGVVVFDPFAPAA